MDMCTGLTGSLPSLYPKLSRHDRYSFLSSCPLLFCEEEEKGKNHTNWKGEGGTLATSVAVNYRDGPPVAKLLNEICPQ